MKTTIISLLLLLCVDASSQTLPKPTENQLRWQEMEMYAFIHYSLNTYTDQEWGFGNEDPKLFNPSSLDCRQWARVCKQTGGHAGNNLHGEASLRFLHVAFEIHRVFGEELPLEERQGRRGARTG